MGIVVEVMLAKSLIACILIRVSLRGCKAIDFILNLHCFSSYHLSTCLDGICLHTHTDIHSRISNYKLMVVITQIVESSHC